MMALAVLGERLNLRILRGVFQPNDSLILTGASKRRCFGRCTLPCVPSCRGTIRQHLEGQHSAVLCPVHALPNPCFFAAPVDFPNTALPSPRLTIHSCGFGAALGVESRAAIWTCWGGVSQCGHLPSARGACGSFFCASSCCLLAWGDAMC